MNGTALVDALLIVGALCWAGFVAIAAIRLTAGVGGDVVIGIAIFAAAGVFQAWSMLLLLGGDPTPSAGSQTPADADEPEA